MSSSPLVSICIPVYNRADLIAETISSALSQTYEPLEILVVDNASTDNTAEVVSQFLYSGVRYIRNPENLGQFGNLNRCIDLSHGDFIHILHSDDCIPPDFIRICIEFFNNHPEVMMTCTAGKIISDESERGKTFFKKNTIFSAPDGFVALLKENFVFCPSVICRRELYTNVGLYYLDFPYAGDYYQWLRISRDHTIAYLNDTYVIYRRGEHSETHTLTNQSMQGYKEVLEIYILLMADCSKNHPFLIQACNLGFFTYVTNMESTRILRKLRKKPFDSEFGLLLQKQALLEIKPISGLERIKLCGYFISLRIPIIFWINLVWTGFLNKRRTKLFS